MQFAVGRRGGLSSRDYWDRATVLELAVIGGDEATASRAKGSLLVDAPPWVTEPGLWMQWDYGDGPIVQGRATVLFCAWLAWSRLLGSPVRAPGQDFHLRSQTSCPAYAPFGLRPHGLRDDSAGTPLAGRTNGRQWGETDGR